MFALQPVVLPKESWTSTFNLEDKMETSQPKVVDGASSEVYIGSFNGMTVVVMLFASIFHWFNQVL